MIYGGTSAAITAAVQSKRMGRSVVVVSPDERLGGLSSNGLCWTDNEMKEVIRGNRSGVLPPGLEVLPNSGCFGSGKILMILGIVGQGSPAADGDQRTMWVFEPKAAMDVFDSWVAENGIVVFRNEWLDRTKGVEMH